jgi:hypothetical protein
MEKTLVLITFTEGGANFDEYNQTKINEMKSRISEENRKYTDHNSFCNCNLCSIVRIFESSKVGNEISVSCIDNTIGYMIMK